MSALPVTPEMAEHGKTEHEKAQESVAPLTPLLVSFLGLLVRAYILLWMWRWFIVPLGVKGMAYWQSVGVLLLVSLIHQHVRDWNDKPNTSETWRKRLWLEYILMAVTFALGWLVHLAASHP